MRNGFSLLEVLVALTVASILAIGLITAQNRAFYLARDCEDRWENLNLSARFLAERYPDALKTPTGGWVSLGDAAKKGSWRLETQSNGNGTLWYTLSTKVSGSALTWEWPEKNP
ncbi:MAG: prepilin-type N-terminal cleavage/methylation domain-containing protein [Thermodesulfobacteriota bacterium]|nr:prepilin-type N-terminal cleavage/methylation domain-containing protein [Thermodesulfobacteriota bacterium]